MGEGEARKPDRRRMSAPNRRNPPHQPRVRPPVLQAMPLLLLLAACTAESMPDPARFWRDASGRSADQRLAPPGMDRPAPNLASVPPVPERPDIAARRSLTAALEADRAAAASPAPPTPTATLPGEAVPGSPPIAAAPPPPPRLAAARPIPAARGPAAPPVLLEPDGTVLAPREVPALPPPELLAPAPPSPDLLAPAPR